MRSSSVDREKITFGMLRSLGSVGTDFKLLTAATCQTKQAVWQFPFSYIILQFHPLVCYDRSSLCYPVPLQIRMITQCHNSNSKTLLQYRCRQFMNAAMLLESKAKQTNAKKCNKCNKHRWPTSQTPARQSWSPDPPQEVPSSTAFANLTKILSWLSLIIIIVIIIMIVHDHNHDDTCEPGQVSQ